MAIIWHDTGGQGTPAWHKIRENLWTGYTAIRLMTGKRLMPATEWDGNDSTRRGHALEVAAIREYERRYRVKVKRPDFVTNTVYKNAGFSPDAIDRAYLLECKALNGIRHEKLIKGNRSLKELEDFIMSAIPLQFKVQIFFGMIITGLRKARLLAFNPEIPGQDELIVIEIGYDKIIGNRIRSLLRLDQKKRDSA